MKMFSLSSKFNHLFALLQELLVNLLLVLSSRQSRFLLALPQRLDLLPRHREALRELAQLVAVRFLQSTRTKSYSLCKHCEYKYSKYMKIVDFFRFSRLAGAGRLFVRLQLGNLFFLGFDVLLAL